MSVHAELEEYSYPWHGKQATATKLRVCFVSMDEKEYCVGIMKPKLKNLEELREARDEKFQVGKIFIATKVTFIEEKPQYIHAPFKHALCLRNTRFSPVLAGTVVLPAVPSPDSSVTEILSIQETKGHRFDITGLCHLSPVRYYETQKGHRAIIDVTLLDDSKLHNEKTGELVFTMFVPCTPEHACPPELTALITLVDANNPVSFFSLTLSVQQGNRDINTYNAFYWKAAQGKKADRLRAMAGELLNLSAEKKEKLTIEFTPKTKRDFLNEPAVQSCCCLMSTCTTVDNSPFAHDKVFQINYATLTPPGIGASVLTTDGRIWLPKVVVSDQTSSITLGMREKAALQLAGFNPDDAEAKTKFVDLVTTGDLPFPMLASIRVHVQKRESKLQDSQDAATPESQGSQDSQTQASEEMRAVIVEAVDQDITVKPNKAYLGMLPYVNKCSPCADRILPASLGSIQKSAHYPLQVTQGNQTMPCQKVLSLVFSTERTKPKQIHEGAVRLTTSNVTDALSEDTKQKFTLTACCAEGQSMKDFCLDPPKSGTRRQAALVFITAATDATTFVLESLQLLPPEEVEPAVTMMKHLIAMSELTTFEGNKRHPTWTSEDNPVQHVKKIRRLNLNPTDEDLLL